MFLKSPFSNQNCLRERSQSIGVCAKEVDLITGEKKFKSGGRCVIFCINT